MVSVRLGVGLGLMAGLLAACVSGSPSPVTGGGTGPSAARGTPGGIPSLPPDYKTIAAKHLVIRFIDDAIGPPEISEIVTGRAIFGASSQVIVRYPVSVDVAAKRNILARSISGTYYRCSGIGVHAGVSTFGEKNLKVETAKIDTTECNPGLKYTRFRELEDLAAQCRAQPRTCGVIRTPLGGSLIDGKTIIYD